MRKFLSALAMIGIILVLLAGCAIDPCSIDGNSPTCETRRSEAQATISAIDADRALRATESAVYLTGKATQAAISARATKQVVQAEATRIAMDMQATRQAVGAISTQAAVALAATQTSINGEATKIAVNTTGVVERARAESAAMPYSAVFNIVVFWFIIPAALVAVVLIYGRHAVKHATAAASMALNKRAAMITYGPGGTQLALVMFDPSTQRPVKFYTSEGMLGNFANLEDGHTALDRLNVPDELKLAALVEANKRSQFVRAAAAGRVPSFSPAYESTPAIPAPQPASIIPAMPTFGELLRTWRPNPQQMLLGLNESGTPRYSQLDRLLSIGVIGLPGSGKSTVLRFHYLQCRLVGARVVVWDLHRSIIKTLPGAEAFVRLETIDQSAKQVEQLLQDRLDRELYDEQSVMILVDEYIQLAPSSETASRVVGRIILEGRKVRMYTMISGHGLPARLFSGSEVRDSLSSKIVLHSTPRQAERVGLDKRAIPWVVGLRPGSAIVEGPIDAEILRVPDTTEADVRAFLPASQPEPEAFRATSPASPEAASAEGLRPAEVVPEVADPFDEVAAEVDPKRQKVLEMLRAGSSQNQVIKSVYGATGGEKYQRASAEIRKIIQESMA